jgi:hypothetical protein
MVAPGDRVALSSRSGIERRAGFSAVSASGQVRRNDLVRVCDQLMNNLIDWPDLAD